MQFENSLVKVQSVRIQGLKNVLDGEIVVHNGDLLGDDEADIVGIYGQNGSGKTAVVDTCLLLERLMEGKPLPEETSQWISKSSSSGVFTITGSFLVGKPIVREDASDEVFQVIYSAEIGAKENGATHVLREKIRGRQVVPKTNGMRARDWVVSRNGDLAPIGPDPLWRTLRSGGRMLENDLLRAEGIARDNGRSVLFSEDILSLLVKQAPESPASAALTALKKFAKRRFFVVDKFQTGMIYMNSILPVSFIHKRSYPEFTLESGGTHVFTLEESDVLPVDAFKDFSNLIDELNSVMGSLIPDFAIEIDSRPSELNADGIEVSRFDLQARRAGVRVPLRFESNGIRRIISILSLLIAVYNDPNVCVVIDELDAGIFEHLLGQLLESLSEGGRGQLIFTSHNLRTMEVLEPRQIVLTTTNPYNRYVRMKGVRPTHNNRDRYYTYIENDENLYKGLSRIRIEAAFKKIGEIWKIGKTKGGRLS